MAAGSQSKTRSKPAGEAVSAQQPVEPASRREQILQAAQKLFADNGFRETNLEDVATQLGFRRQAVYHYFRSKDEILYELIDRAGQSIATSAQPILDGNLAPADKLAEVVRNHVRQLLTHVEVFRVLFTELFKLTTDRADMLRQDMWAYVHAIAEVVAAGQKDGVFVDIPPVAQTLLILSMCNGTTEWYRDDPSRLSVQQIADYAAKMALAGATGAKRRKR
jgi:AcrR family transcriptional regulator